MASGEFPFIDMLRGIVKLPPGARDLRDDAAVLEIGDETLVLTHDVIVEGVHVLPDQDERDIAWKLVMANLSDLAAKGAEPVGVLVGHSISLDDARFAAGLTVALGAYGVDLFGGDTVCMPEGSARSWSMTAIGRACHTPVPSRAGACPGHDIYVTGPLGAAMMAFEELKADSRAEAKAYRRPEPRLYEGIDLAPHVSAMMDISDGLLLDAWRMGLASGASLSIDSASVPIAAPENRREDALSWGEDFELLLTAPKNADLPIPVTAIGEVIDGDAPLTLDGEPVFEPDGLGYSHGG